VLAPFRCEFGYNIHLGDNVVVDVGCYFQDAAEVWLGNGVVVGADCKFFTLDLKSGGKGGGGAAEGSQALFRAGAIRLEDDCVVEGNVTVLPFRTIGKGARVVAGSVVTKDVKPGTVVAGNPAKEVRAEDDRIVEEENSRMLVDMQNGWRGKGFGEG
jgi:acetyltransferase-like isoleucine patch superfamily enzyme